MGEIGELIKRVEALDGPVVEVDEAIHTWRTLLPSDPRWPAPRYTGSLDAAAFLVGKMLPDWDWGRCIDTGTMQVAHRDSDDLFDAKSKGGPALALLLATLRAKQALSAQEPRDG